MYIYYIIYQLKYSSIKYYIGTRILLQNVIIYWNFLPKYFYIHRLFVLVEYIFINSIETNHIMVLFILL